MISRRKLLLRSVLAAPALILSPRRLLARSMHGKGSGGGGYVQKWVECGSNTAIVGVMSGIDSPLRTVAFWANWSQTAFDNFAVVYGDDQSCVLGKGFIDTSDLGGRFYTPDDSGQLRYGTSDGFLQPDTGYFVFVSVDANHPAGQKIINLNINGVDTLDPTQTRDITSAFTLINNNLLFCIPDTSADNWTGVRLSQYRVWNGQIISPTPENIAKFYNSGSAVDPAVANSAFGAPDQFHDGDKNAFPVNQGTAGSVVLAQNIGQTSGSNGPGPVSLPGTVIGDAVHLVWDVASFVDAHEVTADFETVITVNDEIQQTGASDYSGSALDFFVGTGPLNDFIP